MRVLVAGASGNLGREVTKTLTGRGIKVRALSRRPQNTPDDVEPAQADVVSGEGLDAATKDVDVVFSAVGASIAFKAPRSGTYRAVDLKGNTNLLEAARQNEVRRFVYISVFGAANHPELEYLDVHEEVAKKLLDDKNIEASVLEPTGFFSALEMLLPIAEKGTAALIGDGSAKSNPIDDEELAHACVEEIFGTTPKNRRPIGGPEILTRKEMFEAAFAAVDKPPKFVKMPAWPISVATAVIKPFAPRLSALLAFYRTVAQEDAVAPAYGEKTLAQHLKSKA